MILKHKFTSVLATVLALIVQACGSSVDDTLSVVEPGEDEVVVLGLNVVVGEIPGENNVGSRSFADTEDGTFENPATEYEKLKTLRVIIVRPDGTVEHNRYVRFDVATGQIIRDNLEFEVKSGESKRIYLLGNEAAVNFDFRSSNIPEGSIFPTQAVENVTIKVSGTSSPINNGPTSPTRTYIPMSECFDIMIDRPAREEDRRISRTLFITRSLIKFSFSVKNTIPYGIKTNLTGISITGLASSSYYLPRNTVYDPPKDQPSNNNLGGRYITSFEMPANFGTTECNFPVLPYYDLDSEEELTFDSFIYLPETKTTGDYQLRLFFDDRQSDKDENLTNWLGSKPLDLKDIPRNTHVKINITLNGYGIIADVTVVPYTCVSLNPDFGGFEHDESSDE